MLNNSIASFILLTNQKETFMTLSSIILFVSMSFSATATPLNIVATTGMVADITRQVVGEHGEVHALMGEGVDPHLYKPTAADAKAILGADMIFYSGLMLEGRMADTFFKAARFARLNSRPGVGVGFLQLVGGFEFPAPGSGVRSRQPN